jgi:hypothetical protein
MTQGSGLLVAQLLGSEKVRRRLTAFGNFNSFLLMRKHLFGMLAKPHMLRCEFLIFPDSHRLQHHGALRRG